MSDSTLMEIAQSLQNLTSHMSAHELGHGIAGFSPICQVSIRYELHDDEEMGASLVILNVLDYVWLPKC